MPTHVSPRLRTAMTAAALSALLLPAAAAPVLELKPGLWVHDSEVWINGQSLKPAMQALRSKARSQRDGAVDAPDGQACLTPQQARIDLARYLETALADSGPWRCETHASQLDGGNANGSYACRTGGGGLTQGKFSATYGATQYKLELNGRGNVVDGRTGEALPGGDMEQRLLSTGRWLSGSC
ncbi:DUF3617 domain-containing protein [Roseateles sp. DC23W]|uniref:DUF3617 domain-containing protein n=1 Tax=Pelomonas dachongensis TaxID=3299029 RepID=A0ABW7ENV5_9BURK